MTGHLGMCHADGVPQPPRITIHPGSLLGCIRRCGCVDADYDPFHPGSAQHPCNGIRILLRDHGTGLLHVTCERHGEDRDADPLRSRRIIPPVRTGVVPDIHSGRQTGGHRLLVHGDLGSAEWGRSWAYWDSTDAIRPPSSATCPRDRDASCWMVRTSQT